MTQNADKYNLTGDPLFYLTVIFFVGITTLPPALIGQPTFLALAQAGALALFAGLAGRRGGVRQAATVTALWLFVQMGLILLLTWLFPERLDLAFGNGFNFRTAYLEWFYTGQDLPRSVLTSPTATLIEIAGVILGTLATGGLVGAWFLVRAANFAAFGMGGLLAGGESLLAVLPIWTIIKVAGYGGLFILLSRPLLVDGGAIAPLLGSQRRGLLISIGLLGSGLVLELFLPGLWSSWFA